MQVEQFKPADKIEKPVSMLALVPKVGAITRVGRQAYTIMLMLAREQGREEVATGLFSAPLNSIIRGFDGADGTDAELKRHLRSMVSHVVEWQSPSPGEAQEWGACALLAEVKLFKRKGEGWVAWAYPPSLRQEMLNPQRFAQIQRSTVSKFRTHAGLALYENCARYKDNPSHLTSKQHWTWWLPVLTGKPAQQELKTEFRFFNRDTVKPAIEEVNEVSELIVEVREYKKGRSVEYLQFDVRRKPPAANQNPEPIDGRALLRAQELGVPLEAADDLFVRHGPVKFAAALGRLAQRLTQSSAPVRSKTAYLKTILADRSVGEGELMEPQEIESAPAQAKPAHLGEQMQGKTQQSGRDRTALVRTEIESLPAFDLAELLAQYRASIAVNNKPAVVRRLDEGNWKSPVVMGELLVFFWKKTRGTDWTAGL